MLDLHKTSGINNFCFSTLLDFAGSVKQKCGWTSTSFQSFKCFYGNFIFHLLLEMYKSCFMCDGLMIETMKNAYLLLQNPLFPRWMFFPLYILRVWFNISAKIATSDVSGLRVCVFSACWGLLIMNAASRGLWMETLRAFDRQKIIEDEAQQTDWSGFGGRSSECVCMHCYVTKTSTSGKMVKFRHLLSSVKWSASYQIIAK